MKTIAACMVSLSLIACSGGSDETAANANPAQVATAAPAPAPVIEHYYSLEDAGEYGYEQGISEDDRKSGTATKPVVMVRYIGAKAGTYTVQFKDGQIRQITSCKSPCEFVKSKTYYEGTLLKTETMPNNQGSIIWAVMEDAQAGMLHTYGKKTE